MLREFYDRILLQNHIMGLWILLPRGSLGRPWSALGPSRTRRARPRGRPWDTQGTPVWDPRGPPGTPTDHKNAMAQIDSVRSSRLVHLFCHVYYKTGEPFGPPGALLGPGGPLRARPLRAGPLRPRPLWAGPCWPPGPSWARAPMGLKYIRGGGFAPNQPSPPPYLQVCIT